MNENGEYGRYMRPWIFHKMMVVLEGKDNIEISGCTGVYIMAQEYCDKDITKNGEYGGRSSRQKLRKSKWCEDDRYGISGAVMKA